MNRTFLFSCLGLGVLGSFVNAEPIATNTQAPITLTASQMDTITARGSYLAADAVAWGVSENTLAITTTKSTIIDKKSVEIGRGQASAIAYGEKTSDADVNFIAGADGNAYGTTISVTKESATKQGGKLTTADGKAFLVSATVPDGNVSYAVTAAYAYGSSTTTETFSYSVTNDYSSQAASTAFAVSE